MKCQECDAENEAGTFCGKCGFQIRSAESGPTPIVSSHEETEKKGPGGAIALLTFALVLFLVMVFALATASPEFRDQLGALFSNSQAEDKAAAEERKAAADATKEQQAEEQQAEEQAPEAPSAPLAGASTVVGAVTSALATYCPNSNSSQWNDANWSMSSSPVNPPVEGYWELYAPTSGGDYVYVRVFPSSDGMEVTVSPANAYGSQAFDHWGCPASMRVGIYSENY